MQPIDKVHVKEKLNQFLGQEVYLHLETTTGSYASLLGEKAMSVCAYIRNGKIKYHRGEITGNGPYRVGLKMEDGWVYAEGLTDFEVMEGEQLLLAGHDQDGQLGIALQLSSRPFQN
jgi:hypothetical protein